MADRVGFEPTRELPPYTLSRGAPSATRPSVLAQKDNITIFGFNLGRSADPCLSEKTGRGRFLFIPMKPNGTVILKKGREKKIGNHYPWVQKSEIFSSDVPEGSCLVRLLDYKRQFLATASYSQKSRFPVKVLDLQEIEITEEWFLARFLRARALRESLRDRTNSCRFLFSEADQVPGLIVDDFAGHQVVQVRTAPMDQMKHLWLQPMIHAFEPTSLYERSDMVARKDEGLKEHVEQLFDTTPEHVQIVEDGLLYQVPILTGLKTGHYLDQRETRRKFGSQVRPGQKVLDCFSYSGGFALSAARSGAIATAIDIHPVAIESARTNAELNKLTIETIEANVFEYLESGQDQTKYDWIVLDPPAIAKSAGKRDSLKWAIWKLFFNAIPLLAEGGTIIVCNCSFQLSLHETIETCRLAANDRSVQFALVQVTFQDIDHPAPIQFPEALYLKCVWLRKLP